MPPPPTEVLNERGLPSIVFPAPWLDTLDDASSFHMILSLIHGGFVDLLIVSAASAFLGSSEAQLLHLMALGEALADLGGNLMMSWTPTADDPGSLGPPLDLVEDACGPDDPLWARLLRWLQSYPWAPSRRRGVDADDRSLSITLKRGDPAAAELFYVLDQMLPGRRFSRATINLRTLRSFSRLLLHTDAANLGASMLAVLGSFVGGVTRWADGRSL